MADVAIYQDRIYYHSAKRFIISAMGLSTKTSGSWAENSRTKLGKCSSNSQDFLACLKNKGRELREAEEKERERDLFARSSVI